MARKKSALTQVLIALIPYSRQNLLLSFSPNKFFNELEKGTGYSEQALKVAYKRGRMRGLITNSENEPRLTKIGQKTIQPYTAVRLGGQIVLMVIFDIPERKYAIRQKFRQMLKSWDFVQVQKSVWASDMDYKEQLLEATSELGIGRHVQIFESHKLFPSK